MELKEIKKKIKYEMKKVFFITLNNKDNISEIIKFLSKHYPIPNYLKRINKTNNYIKCLVSMAPLGEYISINDVLYAINSAEIPNRSPLNKKEHREFQTFWTYNFFTVFVKDHYFDESFVYSLIQYKKSYDISCSTACLIVDPISKYTFPIETSSHLPWNHGIFKSVKYVSQSEYRYLCTDLDIYVLGNPCFGCCGALLHSRIGNVFMIDIQSPDVFSKYFIHENLHFNHRFRVFKVIYE